LRDASAHREKASIFGCLSSAVASSSQARAHTSQSGYAYFDPRSSIWLVNVAIRAQSRAVTMTDATVFTSGCASPAVTTRSQRRLATLQASIASLNFGGHIIYFPSAKFSSLARSPRPLTPVEKISRRPARFYCSLSSDLQLPTSVLCPLTSVLRALTSVSPDNRRSSSEAI
jgi:hypothetical protein